jgi:hypothetical protein
MNICPAPFCDVASLTIVCEGESWFVQVTVVPFGTVTAAGLKAKFWMVTATGAPVGVVSVGVAVVTGGVVAAVVGVTGAVVAGGVAIGVVAVTTGVWVVVGGVPLGDVVHPAIRTTSRIAPPRITYFIREFSGLMVILT